MRVNDRVIERGHGGNEPIVIREYGADPDAAVAVLADRRRNGEMRYLALKGAMFYVAEQDDHVLRFTAISADEAENVRANPLLVWHYDLDQGQACSSWRGWRRIAGSNPAERWAAFARCPRCNQRGRFRRLRDQLQCSCGWVGDHPGYQGEGGDYGCPACCGWGGSADWPCSHCWGTGGY